MPDVVIYTKSWCAFCIHVKYLLARKGIPFTEVEITGSDALRDEMVARAHGRRTVPQVFIGDIHVGGCDDLRQMENDGRLDALLADGEIDADDSVTSRPAPGAAGHCGPHGRARHC